MSVNGRPFAARQAGPCPAFTCRHGGQIRTGDDIKPVDGLGWIHEDDVTPVQLGRKPLPVRTADELTLEAAADRLLNEYDNRREADRRARNARIPTGNYTIRPADERTAVVLSIGPADFGEFPDGTRKVAVHGSFSILIDGLSQARSWYGFALVKPGGQISVYKNARKILESDPDLIRPEDVHLRSKLRVALKSLRLLIEAGESEIMAYGKAYASAQSACWKCERPLTDETSQRLGIGPKCRQVLAGELGKR
jgi:hypothetical protein